MRLWFKYYNSKGRSTAVWMRGKKTNQECCQYMLA